MNTGPIYETVAGKLRQRILRGHYKPGMTLPPERELCDTLHVSRITVRRALEILKEERLVDRRHGSGTYVSPHPSQRIPLMVDYTGSMRRHAPALRRQLLFSRREPPPAEVATELGLDTPVPLLHARRRDRCGQDAVAVDDAYLPAPFSERLTVADLKRVDFVEVWIKTAQLQIERIVQRVEAVAASPEWAALLEVAAGTPLLRATEIYHAQGDKPCGVFVSHYRPAHIMLVSEYR